MVEIVVDEGGAHPVVEVKAVVQDGPIGGPEPCTLATPDAFDLGLPIGPGTRVHPGHTGMGDENEGEVVGGHRGVGLDEFLDVVRQRTDVWGVPRAHARDGISGAARLAPWHWVVQRLPCRWAVLDVEINLGREHILHAEQPRHIVVVGHAPDDGLRSSQCAARQIVARVMHERLPPQARAYARDPDECVRVAEFILRGGLLQVRDRRSVVRLLREGVCPLPEVVGTTILHGLDQSPGRMPLPGDGRGHDDEIGLIELLDVL
mmetsp:Transcript_70435/g.155863  ORF Transcript_70435/g.155863 Transcript_70435/m.155863 type:complete len:262 (-) Transcript_70435:738-1523(-)